MSIILASFLTIGLIGCQNSKTTRDDTKEDIKQEQIEKEKSQYINPLDNLKKELVNSGLAIGENQMLAFSMVGATNGYKFDVNGKSIEIYYYDVKNLSKEQKQFYDQAQNGSMSVNGFNFPVVFKNNLVLVIPDGHPQKDKILEVFNNFNY